MHSYIRFVQLLTTRSLARNCSLNLQRVLLQTNNCLLFPSPHSFCKSERLLLGLLKSIMTTLHSFKGILLCFLSLFKLKLLLSLLLLSLYLSLLPQIRDPAGRGYQPGLIRDKQCLGHLF